jgi:hypothetical protein
MHAQVNLDEFERFHAQKLRVQPMRASWRELGWTVLVAIVVTPFFAALFLALPLIGQFVVGTAFLLTVYYMYLRRSILVLLSSCLGVTLFVTVAGSVMHGRRFHPGLPLLVLLGFGIPVAGAFCILVASRIWALKGGRM